MRISRALFLLSLPALLSTCAGQGSPFSHEDLASLRPVEGRWTQKGGTWEQADPDPYDLSCFAPVFLSGRYRLSVEIRHLEGSVGGGLIFHSERREAPGHAEMVRFETASSLLQGHFVRGEFRCREVLRFEPPIDPGAWVRLELEIDGEKGTLAVLVEGRRVAEGLSLRYGCGYPALQASHGRVQFRGLSARGKAARDPGLHWVRRLRVHRGGLEVFSPATGRAFRFEPGWKEPRPARARAADFPEPRLPGEVAEAHPGARDALSLGDRLFVALPGRVRILGPEGPGDFEAREAGGFDPVALVSWQGRVWALDLLGSRLVEVPSGGARRTEVDFPGPGKARIRVLQGRREVFARLLEGREPGSRQELRLPQPYRTLPPESFARRLRFQMPPPEGSLRARRLRLLVLIYGRVFEDLPSEAGERSRPDPPDWTRGGYLRLRGELESVRKWFWIQSGFRLLLDPVYHLVEDPVRARDLSADGKANGRPRTSELRKRAGEAGVELSEIQGLLLLQAFRRFDPKGRVWRLTGRGGGLTLGAHGRGYGISWWFVPEKPGLNAWLFCHEFHHQLDALFELSGHPEYWFNHFSPTIGTAADFGEHWDGNAWILRNWPRHLWDNLAFGEEILMRDLDGDGIPDRDPRAPFDELRFGSSPRSRDSDGDGVSDLEEALQSSWLLTSGFETQAGIPFRPDPGHADSDRDGIPDGRDPLPLYPFDNRIPAEGSCRLPVIDDPDLKAPLGISLGVEDWGGKAPILVFRFRGLQREDETRIRMLCDLAGNGWFRGGDNLQVELGPGKQVRLQVQNAAEPGKWPHMDAELAAKVGYGLVARGGELLFMLPFSELLGFPPEPGARLALDIMISTKRSRSNGRGWLSVFEPHDLVPFHLPGK